MVYKFEPSIILEAIMLAIMYLVLTSNHLFASWHHHHLGCEEFHTRKQSNQFPMRTKQWVEKAITFELHTRNFPHNIYNNLASYGELFAG